MNCWMLSKPFRVVLIRNTNQRLCQSFRTSVSADSAQFHDKNSGNLFLALGLSLLFRADSLVVVSVFIRSGFSLHFDTIVCGRSSLLRCNS